MIKLYDFKKNDVGSTRISTVNSNINYSSLSNRNHQKTYEIRIEYSITTNIHFNKDINILTSSFINNIVKLKSEDNDAKALKEIYKFFYRYKVSQRDDIIDKVLSDFDKIELPSSYLISLLNSSKTNKSRLRNRYRIYNRLEKLKLQDFDNDIESFKKSLYYKMK